MSIDNGYRIVTTERLKDRTERFVSSWPPLNEPALDRPAAIERLDDRLKWWELARVDYPADGGGLPWELLPTGRARMKVVTDERAREMAADASVLIGAVR